MALRAIQLFILLLVINYSTCSKVCANEDYQYALALMKERKEYQYAAEKFNTFAENNPESDEAPKALFYMAGCLARLGKDNSAANTYKKIIKLYPDTAEEILLDSYAYGADAYFRAKLYQNAAELYTGLIKNYPESAKAESSTYWLAECHNRLAGSETAHNTENKDYKTAIETYTKLYKAYPDSRFLPDALTSAGLLAYNFKDYENSSFFFSLYDDIDYELEAEKQELITYHYAESLYWLKDYKAAAKRFTRITENYPQGRFIAESYAGLGWCSYAQGEPAKAAEAFRNAAELYQDATSALNSHFDAAAAYEEAENIDNAVQEYSIIIKAESHPKKQAALVRLGILQKDSKIAESASLLSQAFNPDAENSDKTLSIEAGILLGEKKFDLKEYQEAADIFAKIVELAPNSKYAPFALYHLALSRSKLEMYKEASTAIKLLLKNYPDTPLRLQAAYAIADYQYTLGDTRKSNIAYQWLTEEAEKWAARYIETHEVDNQEKFLRDAEDIAAASMLRLAESLYKDKNSADAQDKAKDYFSRYISRFPDNPRLSAALLRMGELTEGDNLSIAHTYFINAISSAENNSAINPDDEEFSNIIMHAKYRLCLNNLLLSKKSGDDSINSARSVLILARADSVSFFS